MMSAFQLYFVSLFWGQIEATINFSQTMKVWRYDEWKDFELYFFIDEIEIPYIISFLTFSLFLLPVLLLFAFIRYQEMRFQILIDRRLFHFAE
ncbi:hypothetical protein L5515_017668 [Caenorhabditis briggsae]|uniref:Uncharacterized protein n=1 Tax=Caenorhabditis briggsae TaxID=6238 RepID=A0AAE9FK24_CAEBR|nr:hypothetical protein L5515_017668 [Caenorhabditis briggsae]